MVEGGVAQVIDALLARAALMAMQGPALPVMMPEVAFTAPADGRYLQVDYFSNRPAWEGLSEGKLAQGLLQVTVVWPRGAGLIQPAQIAQKVINHFAKGTVMFSGTMRVTVSNEPWDTTAIQGDADLRIPVTIPWTASAV